MTTVIDPGATPVPIYNRSGTTYEEINASGSTVGSATAIQRYAGETVIFAHITTIDRAVLLPANAEVGDLVEIYLDDPNGVGIMLFCPGSEQFQFGSNLAATASLGVYCRKLSATLWGILN